MIPKSYVAWYPREGNVIYEKWSVADRVVEKMLEETLAQLEIKPADLERVRVMGQKRPPIVIPEEVALTLDQFGRAFADDVGTLIEQGAEKLVGLWKVIALLNPKRIVGYNLRNLSGDAEPTYVGNPSTFTKLPQATREILDMVLRKQMPTPELREWMRRGGFQSVLQVAEGIAGNKSGLELVHRALGEQPPHPVVRPFKWYWEKARLATDVRETLLRYAAYLDYLDQVQGSVDGRPKNYGASLRDEVNDITDPRDRAFKLANDLLGAYDEITQFGQWLRRKVAPFWSFQEVNFVRWTRMARNAAYDRKLASFVGKSFLRRAGMTLLRSPLIAIRIGRFLILASALAAALKSWNLLRHKDAEESLPPYVRNRPHLIVSVSKDGTVNYLSRLGAFPEFLSWFGADEAPEWVEAYLNGRMTLGEIALAMAKEPPSQFIQMMGPTKTAAEVATGQQLFPDPFRPRPIRDKVEYLFQQWSLDDVYRGAMGRPTRGAGRLAQSFFVSSTDTDEANYNEVRSHVYEEMRRQGKDVTALVRTPKGEALYYFKQAARFGDRQAARKYLLDYIAAGGTDKGLDTSLRNLDPLAGIPEKEEKEYLTNLTAQEQGQVRRAFEYYARLVIPPKDRLRLERTISRIRSRDLPRYIKGLRAFTQARVRADRPVRQEEKRRNTP